jgi:hypothetical protein
MKLEEVVKKRFDELENRLSKVSIQSKLEFFAWSTSAVSLLKKVFGEDSPQYQHFESECRKIRDTPAYYSQGFQACLGQFFRPQLTGNGSRLTDDKVEHDSRSHYLQVYKLPKYEHCEERQESLREATVQVQGLWQTSCA